MRNREPRDLKTANALVYLVCHACGTRGHSADRFCRRCGHALLQPVAERCRNPLSRLAIRLSPAALRGALAVIVAALFVATVATTLPRSAAAEMAGIRIGDSTRKVEDLLGKPQKGPLPLAWRPDHDVKMWQYDLDFDAGGVPNLSVTFVDGRVWRVASLHERYSTRDGLRVGDSLEKARDIYGTGIEEDSDGGLVPWKFVCGDQVVKVIVEAGRDELLAVGIETPVNFKLVAPPPWLEDNEEPLLPGDGNPHNRGDRRVL